MKFLILTLSTLVLVTGCGQQETKPTNLIYSTKYSNNPLLLKKQSKSCESKSFESSKLIDLLLFHDGSILKENYDFSVLLKGLSLRPKNSLSKVYYGEKVEVCPNCSRGQQQLEKPREVELCPEDLDYERETIESAALNTAFFINKTHDKFVSLNTGVSVPSISLNIGTVVLFSFVSNFSGERVKQSTYFTDNAFYQPQTRGIYFLPHSKEFKTENSPNYWEVPMVASHEYGHHLFQSIYQDELVSSGPRGCFSSPHLKKLDDSSQTIRSLTIRNVLNSYNEGFADLIAYYSLSEKERSVKGVKCLDVNRDVESPKFYFGEEKKFSPEVLQNFLSLYENSDKTSCEVPSFQQVHTIGAIFAHHVNAILSHVSTSNDEKITTLVDWVKILKQEKDKNAKLTPDAYLRKTMKSFVELVMTKYHKSKDQALCAKVEAMFPDLDPKECVE